MLHWKQVARICWSFCLALRKRRFWAKLVNRKQGLFPFNALWHYTYCLYSYSSLPRSRVFGCHAKSVAWHPKNGCKGDYSYRGHFLENSIQECKQKVTFSWCASSKTSMLNSLKPNIKIKILICYSLYISYRTSREKFLKYQSNLVWYVINSRNPSVLQSIEITRRNLTLISVRA